MKITSATAILFVFSLLGAGRVEVFAQNKRPSNLKKMSAGLSLKGISVQSTILKDFIFNSANISNGDFRVTHSEGASFREALAQDADFRGAFLMNSDWTAVRGQNINFGGAKLTRANFHLAQLQNCSFWGADLTQADFSKADLKGCDLRNSILLYTQFPQAKYNATTRFPKNFPATLKDEMIFEP